MWKWTAIAFALVIAALLGGLFAEVNVGGVHIIKLPTADGVTYADFVSILLTVFGVIVAIASIALATAGVIGWNSIETKAMNTAKQVTSTNINDADSAIHKLIKDAIANPNSPLHQTLKSEAQRVMFEGVSNVNESDDQLASDGGRDAE